MNTFAFAQEVQTDIVDLVIIVLRPDATMTALLIQVQILKTKPKAI